MEKYNEIEFPGFLFVIFSANIYFLKDIVRYLGFDP